MLNTGRRQKQPGFREGLEFGLPLGLLQIWFFINTTLYQAGAIPWTWLLLPILLYFVFAFIAGGYAAFRWKAAHAGTDVGGATGVVSAVMAVLVTLVVTILHANLPHATVTRFGMPGTPPAPNSVALFFVLYMVPINFGGILLSLLAGRIGGMIGSMLSKMIKASAGLDVSHPLMIKDSAVPDLSSPLLSNQQQPGARSG